MILDAQYSSYIFRTGWWIRNSFMCRRAAVQWGTAKPQDRCPAGHCKVAVVHRSNEYGDCHLWLYSNQIFTCRESERTELLSGNPTHIFTGNERKLLLKDFPGNILNCQINLSSIHHYFVTLLLSLLCVTTWCVSLLHACPSLLKFYNTIPST